MKRILFLVSSMQGGGAERVAALLSNYWVEQGHKVILMPTYSGRGKCLYPLDPRVQLDFLADRVGSRRNSLLNKFSRLAVLRRTIREVSPDVILSFLPHVNVAAIFATKGLNIPVVVSERTYPPSMRVGLVLGVLRKFLYSRASFVVVQTEQARSWLTSCCPNAHGHVIANPVVYPMPQGEPFIALESVVGHRRKLALAVGRLGWEKGFNQLLAAFRLLADNYQDWDLVILGEGVERDALEQLREQLGLTDRVHLPGRVGNLKDWYSRADIYVMSSRFEGFPNSLAEAMSHGLPAVSFDCDAGPRDIIRDGIDGYLVPVEASVTGLSRAMETLMKDEYKRHIMSIAAMAVREKFSMECIAAEWEVVLKLKEPKPI